LPLRLVVALRPGTFVTKPNQESSMKATTFAVIGLFIAGCGGVRPLGDHGQVASDRDELSFAFDGKTDPRGIPSPWQLTEGTGKAQWSIEENTPSPGQKALSVKSERASFFFADAAQPFDPNVRPIIGWSWQAVTLPDKGDVRKSSLNPFSENLNDQAVQLVVTFENGNAINYAWDTTAPQGTEVKEQNPFVNIMSVVVESGAENVGKWRSYSRNLVEDYAHLHGGVAPLVKAIVVQTNSNHTRSKSAGLFGPITVTKK
jgi:hypothetical protein